MTIAKEKKALRKVKKRLVCKTAKGSIAKVRRRYPGTASLRDTSSEGSVSSGAGSHRSSGPRKLKLKQGANLVGNLVDANSGSAKANLVGNLVDANSGSVKANLVGNLGNENSGFAEANLVGNLDNENPEAEKATLVEPVDNENSRVEKNNLVENKDYGKSHAAQTDLVSTIIEARHMQDDVSTLGTGGGS